LCRIVGLKSKKKLEQKVFENLIISMRDTLIKGGPDAASLYLNPNQTVAFGHRRLSILDLSEAGIQPMKWQDWVICYNGEVYNYKEIKSKLPDYKFTTGTDTEVIIKAFDKWGYDAVQHFRGMFVFALYNEKTEKLILCRDRVGVKPLYWYQKRDLFMFASELKAFHEHPKFDKSINQEAVSLYLQQGYIPAPHCIFKYVHKLEPGHFLEIDKDQEIRKVTYWDAKIEYQKGYIDLRKEVTITEELEEILKESFKLRMVADVPVGMFLSGGIDSSLVTALLQNQYNHSLKTFTIGFEDKKLNEAGYAKQIAKHLGTDHTELYCTEQDAINIIPKLADIYDEPFGDSSGIPTFLVSELAREQVTVSLSADGGDELFGGYTKYEFTQKYQNQFGKLPKPIRKGLSFLANQASPEQIERYGSQLPVLRNYNDLSNKVAKFQKALPTEGVVDFFNIASTYLSPKELELYHPLQIKRYAQNDTKIKKNGLLAYLGMIDIKTYLEGDIMTKVDRATMQVALEGREPFLDHHIIEFSQRIPDYLKIKDGKAKYILRNILYKYVPKKLLERPKMGFAIPIKKWLLDLLLDELKTVQEDQVFFDAFQLNSIEIRQTIDQFIRQKQYVNPHLIWFIFVLHQWYERWIK